MATHISRPTPKQAPPKPVVDIYRDIEIGNNVVTTVKLKAYDISSGEIVRSAEHRTANYGEYRSFARNKTIEFATELRQDGYEIRRNEY